MSVAESPSIHRFTVSELRRIYSDDKRAVELIDGAVYDITTESAERAWVVSELANELRDLFGSRRIREAHPISLSEYDEPEPDIALLVAPLSGTSHPAPTDIACVVEVALTSLAFNLGVKADGYRGHVESYIVVDVSGRQIRLPEGFGAPPAEVVTAAETLLKRMT